MATSDETQHFPPSRADAARSGAPQGAPASSPREASARPARRRLRQTDASPSGDALSWLPADAGMPQAAAATAGTGASGAQGAGAASATGAAAGHSARAASSRRGPKNRAAKQGKKKRRWLRRIALGFLFTFLAIIIAGTGTLLYLYSRAQVPAVDQFALAQTTNVYYADGNTKMGSLSEVNRTIIDPTTLPDYVSKAVVASEDRTFYENSGIDVRGIFRALVSNVTTGTRQGGSSLTQQYVERYYMGQTTDYVGKLEEAILAVKINREQTKDEILGNYLNTIYFGRGAYGIEAASQAYFGHPAKDMTLSEAAMIAGIIPAPSAWDPAIDPDQAKIRWQRVIDLMVEDGWIKAEDAKGQTFPKTIDPATMTAEDFSGPNGYLMQQVRAELTSTGAFTDDQIDTGGLKIITTIDKGRQDAMVAAANSMKEVEGWDPATMKVAMSSVDPRNGEIVAEFGGEDYQKRQQNAATQDINMAGSTFKAFTLLANAELGGSINDVYDGNSPKYFASMEIPVSNDGGHSFGKVDMVKAMKFSINTAFVGLNEDVGPENTKKAAIAAGIPEDTTGLDDSMLNVLGFAAPTNLDLSNSYATIASGGKRVTPHIIREVQNPDGSKAYAPTIAPEEKFNVEDVSSILPAMQAVTDYGGTAEEVAELSVASGGKTGTSEEQKSAQFIGFVPELSTAVTMYKLDENGNPLPLDNIGGLDQFHGGDWPVDVWMHYMKAIEGSLTVQDFEWYEEVYRPATNYAPQAQSAAPSAPAPEEAPQSTPAPAPEAPQSTPAPNPQPAPPAEGGQSTGGGGGGGGGGQTPPPPGEGDRDDDDDRDGEGDRERPPGDQQQPRQPGTPGRPPGDESQSPG